MSAYTDILIRCQTKLDTHLLKKSELDCNLKTIAKDYKTAESARKIVNEVMLSTQNQVKEFIENITTTALQVVFGNKYSFVIDYEIKRNNSEASIYIVHDGLKLSMDEVGGGVLDIVAIGLRLALWSISKHIQPILILDEPGKHVSQDKQGVFAEMLKKISEMFNLQIIVISHTDAIINIADRSFEVVQTNGVSKVEEL